MATVSVACKIPNGLIMELIEPGPLMHPLPSDPTKRVVLKGPASNIVKPAGNPLAYAFVTTEVEDSFAREWFDRNKDLPAVKNGMVFMQQNQGNARAVAKERAGLETGFEPLNPAGDSRTGAARPDAEAAKRAAVI